MIPTQTLTPLEPDPSRITEAVNLEVGRRYAFRGIRGPDNRWRWPPANYRLVGVGHHVHTHQEQVVYQGEDGKFWFTTMTDWHKLFTLVPEFGDDIPPLPADPVPKRSTRRYRTGMGGCQWCGAEAEPERTLCPRCLMDDQLVQQHKPKVTHAAP